MRYELIPNGHRGVLQDRTPALGDVRDTFTVSFSLPESGAYLALFTDAAGIEYRKSIRDGTCKVPKELFAHEQYVALTVCRITDDSVAWSWECEPLKVTSLIALRQNQWELSGGMTDENCYTRLNELERRYAQTLADIATVQSEADAISRQAAEAAEYTEQIRTELSGRIDAMQSVIADVKTQNRELAENYNKAIAVVNDLSRRLKALEKNYDPTIIE